MYIGNKEIISIYKGSMTVSSVYKGAVLVWQNVRSCFGGGGWDNNLPWDNDDGWKN